MKILLDENLPHELRRLLPGHDAFTVAYLGWSGTKTESCCNALPATASMCC
jgi:predicted nuclease of predicted toxin-antitoxin system